MTRRPLARGGWPTGVGGVLVVLVAAAACTDLPTDPSEPFALTFERLPYPSVVVGDTLRDAAGVAAPLQATVYNGAGELITDAPVVFRVLDPGAVVDEATGIVTGVALTGGELATGIRVIADAGGIQSLPLLLDVVRRPDSLHVPDAIADTAEWSIPTTTDDRSVPLEASVLHVPAVVEGEPVAEPVGVRSWLVRYAFVVGDGPATSDSTSLFWFVDDGGRRSAVDTTGENGMAARRLRINGNEAAALAGIDSVVVIVTAEGAGPLRNEPGRIIVPIRRRSTTP